MFYSENKHLSTWNVLKIVIFIILFKNFVHKDTIS